MNEPRPPTGKALRPVKAPQDPLGGPWTGELTFGLVSIGNVPHIIVTTDYPGQHASIVTSWEKFSQLYLAVAAQLGLDSGDHLPAVVEAPRPVQPAPEGLELTGKAPDLMIGPANRRDRLS